MSLDGVTSAWDGSADNPVGLVVVDVGWDGAGRF